MVVPNYPASTRPGLADRDGNLSLLRLLDVALGHRWFVSGVTVGVAALLITWAALRPLPYAAESRFMPAVAQGKDLSGLRGFAGQLGLDLSTMDSGESLEFYAELVKSPDLLQTLVLTEFDVKEEGVNRRARLVDLLGVKGSSEQDRTRKTVRLLQNEMVSVSLHKQAGLVKITTLARQSSVAAGMNRRLLELVAEFNQVKRQSQAGAERRFAHTRLTEAKKELDQAEGRLRAFMERNRQIQSPQLVLEQGRLERQISMVQQVYTSLAQAYEEARINEVRNTPIITVIEQPERLVERTNRRLPLFVVAGLLLGFTVALVFVAALTALETQMSGEARYPEIGKVYGALRRKLPGRHAAAVQG
jgi:uncharacterized protein involved in exopolysaccharide biosynthesis